MNPSHIALAAALAATLTPGLPAEESPTKARAEVYVLDPKLPEGISQDLRRHLLDELRESLEVSLGGELRVRPSAAASALVLRSDAATRQEATKLVADLRERMLSQLPALQAEAGGRSRRGRDGDPLELKVQIAMASQEATSEHPLPAKLSEALGKAMGFRSFEVLGTAAAQAIVGEETELRTIVPFGDQDQPLSVELKLTPRTVPGTHDVMMKVAFEVSGRADEKTPIHTNLATTYRPKAGVPLVIGASPVSQGNSLVFLVTHSGPGAWQPGDEAAR